MDVERQYTWQNVSVVMLNTLEFCASPILSSGVDKENAACAGVKGATVSVLQFPIPAHSSTSNAKSAYEAFFH